MRVLGNVFLLYSFLCLIALRSPSWQSRVFLRARAAKERKAGGEWRYGEFGGCSYWIEKTGEWKGELALKKKTQGKTSAG